MGSLINCTNKPGPALIIFNNQKLTANFTHVIGFLRYVTHSIKVRDDNILIYRKYCRLKIDNQSSDAKKDDNVLSIKSIDEINCTFSPSTYLSVFLLQLMHFNHVEKHR